MKRRDLLAAGAFAAFAEFFAACGLKPDVVATPKKTSPNPAPTPTPKTPAPRQKHLRPQGFDEAFRWLTTQNGTIQHQDLRLWLSMIFAGQGLQDQAREEWGYAWRAKKGSLNTKACIALAGIAARRAGISFTGKEVVNGQGRSLLEQFYLEPNTDGNHQVDDLILRIMHGGHEFLLRDIKTTGVSDTKGGEARLNVGLMLIWLSFQWNTSLSTRYVAEAQKWASGAIQTQKSPMLSDMGFALAILSSGKTAQKYAEQCKALVQDLIKSQHEEGYWQEGQGSGLSARFLATVAAVLGLTEYIRTFT